MPVGNLLLCAAILLSGGIFSSISLFAASLNIVFISKSLFYDLQKSVLWPVINKAWNDHVGLLRMIAKDKAVKLCGDCQCDSPGYSATLGTYSVRTMDSGHILGFSQVHVSETSSSVAMEREGLSGLLKELQMNGLSVSPLATDRSPRIHAMMRKDFSYIPHQFCKVCNQKAS